MSLRFAAIALLTMALLALGCNKQDEKPVPAPTAPPTPKSSAAGVGMVSNPTPPPVVPPAANGAAANASAAAQTQAKQLIDQTLQYVKENKLDLAEKTLGQLDAMKSQLPPDWSPRIEQARSAVNVAKAGSAMQPPATMPGPNK